MHLLPWLMLGATQAWLHGAAASPHRWGAILLEAGVLLWIGLALHRLGAHRRRWLADPAWALTLPLVMAALQAAPPGWRAMPYATGVIGLAVGATYAAVRRWTMPTWVAAAVAPVLVLSVHLGHALGPDWSAPDRLIDRTARDLAGPWALPSLRSTADGRSIVLITVDTLRADDAREMDSWARLAGQGAWWPAAQAPSSWTLPSMASLMTGTPSSTHGAGCLPAGFCQGVDPSVSTLADRLGAAGYATLGVSANPWAGRLNGLHRGFQRFHDLGTDRRRPLLLTSEALLGPHPQAAESVVDLVIQALPELSAHDAFFLWVHLIDPHMPYTHATGPLAAVDAPALRSANVLPFEQRAQLRQAYRDEIAYTDRQVLRLLQAIEELAREPVIVFTSDHGEEFWEHGGVEHGHSHHREVVEVPLVIRGPGMRRGRHVSLVSLLDVAPTVLALLDQPDPDLPGHSLGGRVPSDRVLPVEGSLHHRPLCSAVSHDWRVIREDCTGPEERFDAYDRLRDPSETRPMDLVPAHPVRRAAAQVALPQPRGATAQDTEALRALGYVD